VYRVVQGTSLLGGLLSGSDRSGQFLVMLLWLIIRLLRLLVRLLRLLREAGLGQISWRVHSSNLNQRDLFFWYFFLWSEDVNLREVILFYARYEFLAVGLEAFQEFPAEISLINFLGDNFDELMDELAAVY
jgi:hypothetical protein